MKLEGSYKAKKKTVSLLIGTRTFLGEDSPASAEP